MDSFRQWDFASASVDDQRPEAIVEKTKEKIIPTLSERRKGLIEPRRSCKAISHVAFANIHQPRIVL
jgi:hypothetical protein